MVRNTVYTDIVRIQGEKEGARGSSYIGSGKKINTFRLKAKKGGKAGRAAKKWEQELGKQIRRRRRRSTLKIGRMFTHARVDRQTTGRHLEF